MKSLLHKCAGGLLSYLSASFLFFASFIIPGQAFAQYCTPYFESGCDDDQIDDFSIPALSFSHTGTGCSPDTYGDFSSMNIGEMYPDNSYSFEIINKYEKGIARVWIDFNNNEEFEESEQVTTTSSSTGSGTFYNVAGTIDIPSSASPGTYRMRVALGYYNPPAPCHHDDVLFGEAHDYTVTILPLPCDMGTAHYDLIPDCESETYMLQVNITSMGDADSFNITDGITSIKAYSTGVYSIGEYPASSVQNVILEHSSSAPCNIYLGNLTYHCPALNSTCADAEIIYYSEVYTPESFSFDVSGTFVTQPSSCDDSPEKQLWHAFEATSADGRIIITDLTSADPDINNQSVLISLFEGTCDTLTQIDCQEMYFGAGDVTSGDLPFSGLTVGNNYFVVLTLDYGEDHYSNQYTANHLSYSIGITNAITNDDCENATVLYEGIMLPIESTRAATESPGFERSCGEFESAESNDVWYTFTAGSNGPVTIEAGSSTEYKDIVLFAYEGSCSNPLFLTCEDSGGSGTPESLTIEATAGNQYFIRLFGYNDTEGFVFSIQANGSPLSVEFSSIQAENKGKSNVISWRTASEEVESVFILERSSDGKAFHNIALIESTGSPSFYSHTDSTPFTGYNFYRVHLINPDGKVSYSNVVNAYVSGDRSILNVFPTLASNSITVELAQLPSAAATLTLSDVTGRTLYHLDHINSSLFNINISHLSPGMYFIRYSDEQNTETIKVVKQ